MTKHWWHPDRLPQIQQSKKRPLDGAKNAERSWHEQDPADLRRPLVVSDFGVADAAPAHPRQLGFGGRSQRPDVGHRNHQRRRRCRRHLSKAEFRRGCLSRRRFHPKETVRLHVETGGSMASRIEDLFTQYSWDFDRLKSLNCPPMENRFQDFAHRLPPCCYYNIEVLHTQHTNAMRAPRLGLHCGTRKTIWGQKSSC